MVIADPRVSAEGAPPVQLGLIDLGRMGAKLVTRLTWAAVICMFTNVVGKPRQQYRSEGRQNLHEPRGFCVQAAERTRGLAHATGCCSRPDSLLPLLEPGDSDRWRQILLSRRSSSHGDRELAWFHHVDVRVSGGALGIDPRLLSDDQRRPGRRGAARSHLPRSRVGARAHRDSAREATPVTRTGWTHREADRLRRHQVF